MSRTIKIQLTTRSINAAIKQIEAYRSKLPRISARICEELAKKGLENAEVLFEKAAYDGIKDAKVTIEPTERGYSVVASGKTVAFIEFGTGVHYNSGASYPLPKPSGIVGIGEYGKGQGKKDSWRYQGEKGTNGVVKTNHKTGVEWIVTHGNPAQMPMYHALLAMQNEAERIVKEAFKDA